MASAEGILIVKPDSYFTDTRVVRCDCKECIHNNQQHECNLKRIIIMDKGECYDKRTHME